MPRTKAGEKITWKDWMQRWKKGVEGISPLQQANIQIRGTHIIILGLCCGIFITALNIKDLWWLTLILIGGLFNSTMQWVGLYQKKKILQRLYDDSEPEESAVAKFNNKRKGMGDMGVKIETSVEGLDDKHLFVEDDITAKDEIQNNQKEVDLI